jgi:Trypsin-like peptidase domain
MSDPEKLKQFRLNELLAELRFREARAEGAGLTDATPESAPVASTPSPLAQFATSVLADAVRDQQKVIYGTDDRKDLFEVTDPAVRADANSVVSLFRAADVIDNGDGTSTLQTQPFGAALNLCSSERFRTQPIGAFCSGFVVGPDLIATAGHCVTDANVTDVRFVFGYRMNDASTAETVISNNEIYQGAVLVARKQEDTGSDFSVVKVDRPIAGHPIVSIRKSGTIPDGQAVHVIGHPVGLPIKFAPNANVRDNSNPNFFVANLDTYGGNSGSPVFNSQTHVVEGILVRGETDFVSSGMCKISLVCPNNGCRGEDSTRTTQIAPFVP